MSKELPFLIRREVPRNEVSGKSIEGYRADAYFIIHDELLGEVGVIKKWTRYVDNPADVMIMPFDSNISQLTELDSPNGTRFIELCFHLAVAMRNKSGCGFPVVAINQQTDCVKLPSKFTVDGTEVKVQTIDQLHAHVFVEDGRGIQLGKIRDLPKEDRYCFYDPLAEIVSEIMFDATRDMDGCANTKRAIDNEHFPTGLSFGIRGSLNDTGTTETAFTVMNEVQSMLVRLYRELEAELMNKGHLVDLQRRMDVSSKLTGMFNLSRRSRMLLHQVLVNMREDSEEERKFMRFIQGPALTWIIYESDGKTIINFSPRILSRGNASESLGIWVEPVDPNDVAESSRAQSLFFKSLVSDLQTRFILQDGPQISQYEQ